MSPAAAREGLWSRARALSEVAGADLSPRARRLACTGDPPLTCTDVMATPDWASAHAGERLAFARLTGGVLVSRRWSRAIDGALLGRAAAAVGDAELDALINLPDVVAPSVPDRAAEDGEAAAVERLGASALMAAERPGAALGARLSRLFPAGLAGGMDPVRALTARHTAESVRRELTGSAA